MLSNINKFNKSCHLQFDQPFAFVKYCTRVKIPTGFPNCHCTTIGRRLCLKAMKATRVPSRVFICIILMDTICTYKRFSWRLNGTWTSEIFLHRNWVCVPIQCPTEKERFHSETQIQTNLNPINWYEKMNLPHREPKLSTSVQASLRIWKTKPGLHSIICLNTSCADRERPMKTCCFCFVGCVVIVLHWQHIGFIGTQMCVLLTYKTAECR